MAATASAGPSLIPAVCNTSSRRGRATRNASSSSKATLQPMEGKMTYVLYGLGTWFGLSALVATPIYIWLAHLNRRQGRQFVVLS